MSKVNVLTIRVLSDIKHRIARIAEEQGVSINQPAMYVFAKEIGNLEANQKILKYSKKQILNDFDIVMKKLKNKSVPAWDKLL